MKIEIEPKELADFVIELQNRLTNSKCDPKEVVECINKEFNKVFNQYGLEAIDGKD